MKYLKESALITNYIREFKTLIETEVLKIALKTYVLNEFEFYEKKPYEYKLIAIIIVKRRWIN